MWHLRLIVGVGLVSLCGCAPGSALSSQDTILGGDWGGVHAGLALTPERGTISYDCGHGGLYAPVRPNQAGRFEVAGVHVREHGGPVRLGAIPDSVPARYIGQVTGDSMELRVLVGPDTLGPFTLVRGAAPRLFRCL